MTRSSPWSAVADAHEVVANSGRRRRVFIVCCPFCGDSHVHTTAADGAAPTRRASCQRGRYRLLVRGAP